MNLSSRRHRTGLSAWPIGLLALVAGTANAADAPPPGKSASIPFASHNIRDWSADGEKGIWVQDSGRRWYYGAFDFPCRGLDFKLAVRVLSGPTDELDRWGGIETRESGKCRFKSFETSAGPPKPAKKGKAADASTPEASASAPAASAPSPATVPASAQGS